MHSLAVLLSASLASATPPRAVAVVGVGLPEVVHVSLGAFVSDRWTLEARYSNVVFNHLVGMAATGHLLGEAPDGRIAHNLLVMPRIQLNPTRDPLTLQGGGEQLGALLGVGIGYARHGSSGLVLRAQLDGFVYEDDGPAAGVGPSVSVGWGL